MTTTSTNSTTARRVGIWTIALIVLGVAIWLVVGFATTAPTAATLPADLAKVSATDHTQGKGSTTLIEYADFQCPACKYYYPLVKQLSQELGDRVTIVYREFPLTQIHHNAERAIEAAEAADLQGKFWSMHDKLFEGQDTWADSTSPDATFEQYAQDLGLDLNKFKSDISSSAVADRLKAVEANGVAANIQATPTFFLNGKQLANPNSYDDFKAAVSQAAGS